MKAIFPMEFQHIFNSGDDDAPMTETPDALDKFFANAELEHGGIDLRKFQAETALIDEPHRQHYLDLAKAAEKASPQLTDSALAKRASGARLEKSENGKWVYQYDERGSLVSGREVHP